MASENIDLSSEACVPCQSGSTPMAISEALKILENLDKSWSINSAGHLERIFLLKDFNESLRLAVMIGQVAERAGHHPDLLISFGKLRVEIWTHKISGLSRADFVLAAKIDKELT